MLIIYFSILNQLNLIDEGENKGNGRDREFCHILLITAYDAVQRDVMEKRQNIFKTIDNKKIL